MEEHSEHSLEILIKRLKNDFEPFKNRCMGILLFGSYATGDQTQRSDIDICIVKPCEEFIDEMYARYGNKYDVKVFEKLPLYVKIGIIENHVMICGSEPALSEYFYYFRKLWDDMRHRIVENSYKNLNERMTLRRRWLNEKKKILGEAGVI